MKEETRSNGNSCKVGLRRNASFLLHVIFFAALLINAPALCAVADNPCEEWVGEAVSVQGAVEVRRSGSKEWVPVGLHDRFCAGDMIRVLEKSRAAVALRSEAILRLDETTTISISASQKEETSILDFFMGAVYFFSRFPRSLKVLTPFVNAAVEGTEFFIRVEKDRAFLSVFEGRVNVSAESGSLMLAKGESALAGVRRPPVRHTVANPREAVRWTLYYPPVLDHGLMSSLGSRNEPWQAMVEKSVQFRMANNPTEAISSLEPTPEGITDPLFFVYRAELLLSVGRLDAAGTDIAKALELDPSSSPAYALLSIIAVVSNEKEKALDLAQKAVGLDPRSPAARIALSYAQQAWFDMEATLDSLRTAVDLDPQDPLALSRLSELYLSVGELHKALEAARRATALNPNLARTQTVLGYAYLMETKIGDSKECFQKAIRMDQADPLPRLGLGLALIREGELDAGRREIEIAAGLDPGNSLVRSYLGKAYFEEKRDRLAAAQLDIAKQLDPMDPTPWFYDAIRKQTVNRPVEALHDLQKSIDLNDNRAVYRSRLLLDQDLAARSASLASIYDDLGFRRLALVEGWKSLGVDPANHSAHRFLADAYFTLPRHEIARVSELLQSQLLQPLNISPVQPQIAESKLLLASGAGPANPSFNEFNPLFNRNGLSLLTSGVAGENKTLADEVVLSGIYGNVSASFGQSHFETDGFRENNDQKQDIYDAFIQASLSHNLSVQAEYRSTHVDRGDLFLLFDPRTALDFLREEEQTDFVRLGLHYSPAPDSDFLVSLSRRTADFEQPDIITDDETGHGAELQHIYHSQLFSLISGMGYFNTDRRFVILDDYYPLIYTPETHHGNLYAYSLINYPERFTWTLGFSADFFQGGLFDRNQFNPKLGVTWRPLDGTTLRAAFFRTLKRTLLSDQTVEPTQVAGFNQFFDDAEGTTAWRYGVGIDQKLGTDLFAGAEFSKRELTVPAFTPGSDFVPESDNEEYATRGYLYWTPHPWLAMGPEYLFEHYRRPSDSVSVGPELFSRLTTHRLGLGVGFFHPSGISLRLRPSYLYQTGKFNPGDGSDTVIDGKDKFWILDGSLSYRLPQRFGIISIEARNLFDERFRFQDTNPANPDVFPERVILGKFTFAF